MMVCSEMVVCSASIFALGLNLMAMVPNPLPGGLVFLWIGSIFLLLGIYLDADKEGCD